MQTLKTHNASVQVQTKVYPGSTWVELQIMSPGVSCLAMTKQQTLALISALQKSLN